MDQVEEQLESARESLLDMSLRNKLLNFKQYKKSTVSVIDEVPSEVFDILVFNGKTMAFLPDEDPSDNSGEENIEAMDDLWDLPEINADGVNRHTDTYLQTPHGESNLQKRLYNIDNRAGALIEDAGYNALHLAVGFLEWTEAQAHEDPNRAPLLLIPVSLERDGAQSAFKLSWTEAEVTDNLSLELKLSEQGFELPDFERPESKADVRNYLQAVEKQCDELTGWRVTPEIHLGFFDYTKFVMYQDLDPEGWENGQSPADHKLIRSLLDPNASTTEPAAFNPEDIDRELSSMDVHHVLDADPSQIAAIEDVKRGRNMVIEGPPGTGKSQTIVNMIAELLAEDKTVLFVSEKLAALEVVKERMDAVNIGDFALQLHSDKASKSDFLDELERLAKVGGYTAESPRNTFQRLEQNRRELDAYAEALRSPYGGLERNPFLLFGDKEEALQHFESKNVDFPRVQIENVTQVTPDEKQAALSVLRTIRSQLETVTPVAVHPWQGCHPGQLLPQDRKEITGFIDATLNSLQRLQIEKTGLEDGYGISEAESIGALQTVLEAAELLDEGETIDADLLQNSVWNQRPARADNLLKLLKETQQLQSDVGRRTNVSRIDTEIPELLTEYRRLSESMLRWIRPDWYRLKPQISTLYGDDTPGDSEQVIDDLEELIKLQQKQRDLNEAEQHGRELFGSLWDGVDSDAEKLRQFSLWIVDFRQRLITDVFTEDSIAYLAKGQNDDELRTEIEELRYQINEFQQSFQSLAEALGIDSESVFSTEMSEARLDQIESKLLQWQSSMDRLDEWARFDQTREQLLETVAAPLVEFVTDGTLEPEDVVPCFEGSLADSLIVAAFQDREALLQFDRNVHEDRIEEFQKLDKKSLKLNRKRVLASLVGRTPQLMQGASKSSQAGNLLHEFGKQRMHKPIRVLLQEAGGLIQQLKPCFMMSPLSAAKYLDPETMDFDVVIFDEASQVRPQDALGAIMRGNQLVLFGDTKQLPPTSFFDQVVDHRDEEEKWEFDVQDVESILDLCRSSFPTKRLKWHYRSRHESLIAVSNQEFYDNELLVYPSPVQDTEELGLSLNHLPDTIYDRGGSSVNREEARAVAQAAVDHYRETPAKSLGIGTFSQSQQEAVRDEIERLRKENPEVDEYFSRDRDEHFFVKNLERIQGDERDVIFISVGYGYDANGNFNHNLGPLNNTGGWRRLNVLITRARERCVVFSNFKADAIDMSSTNARGIKSLKVFLDYAENRNLQTLTDVGEDPDSPFERGVINFLQDNGYEVHPQVGCAGFRIDLAIPDPERPGRYVLGIECDGASYHSSPVARARDRQREAILEDRGWDIHRIWSTDWYRNREKTQQRLLKTVENAVEQGALNISDSTASNGADDDAIEADKYSEKITIEELHVEEPNLSLDDLSDLYRTATSVPYVNLSDYDVSATARAVKVIVKSEGPIHRELLEKRIIDNSDVERRGKKVKLTIKKGISNAVRRGTVQQDGDFYSVPNQASVPVRKRNGEAANIEWISESEIEAAVLRVLENQYATAHDDLVSQTSRLLGFERTGKRISNRVGGVIKSMEKSGILDESDDVLGLS